MPIILRLLIAAAVLALPLAFPANAGAVNWDPPLKISGTQIDTHNPAIAVGNDGVVHVVWHSTIFDGSGNETDREIYYARSTDNGASFSAPVNLSNSPSANSFQPSISVAVDQSSAVHVVWHEFGGAQIEVRYLKSTNGGVSWPSSSSISDPATPSAFAYVFAQAGSDGNVIHAAWTACPADCDIYYTKSADGGATFQPLVNASNRVGFDRAVVIVANNTAIHLVWQGADLRTQGKTYHARSTDAGSSFSAPQRMSTSSDVEVEPTAVIDGGGRLHIAWETHYASGGDIFWRRSINAGTSFEPVANRSNNPSTVSSGPSLSAPLGGQVSLAWSEESFSGGTQFNQNYASDSPNGGSMWQTPGAIAGPGRSVFEPAMIQVGNRFFIVWEQTNASETATEIFFAKGA